MPVTRHEYEMYDEERIGELLRAMPPAPEQTIESVKEDVQWAKTRAKSEAR